MPTPATKAGAGLSPGQVEAPFAGAGWPPPGDTGCYGFAGLSRPSRRAWGVAATSAFTAKTPRHATTDDTARGGTPCSAWLRTEHESTSRTTATHQSAAWKPATALPRE